MTLSEAIEHLKKDIPNIECKECREEHIQLLNWLEILDVIKRNWASMECYDPIKKRFHLSVNFSIDSDDEPDDYDKIIELFEKDGPQNER